MFLLYSVALTIGFILLLPRFIFDGITKGKYAAGFRQRMGRLPDFDAEGKPVVWIHAVSVGEIQAVRPLISEIKNSFPNFKIVVSTTTNTGQQLADDVFEDIADLVCYFPFDWRFTVRRALRKIDPAIVLIMETEIWFNFIREAGKRGASVFVVNGRLSDRSKRRYQWIRNMLRRTFHYVELALMQGAEDAKRLMALGIRGTKVKVTGNLKFDQDVPESESELTGVMRRRFGILPEKPLIIAASTHAPEEELILQAFEIVRKSTTGATARLMIAPRHPERFDEVAKAIRDTGVKFARRSAAPKLDDENADIVLLDSIGELRAAYPLAEIVFVGGSLIPHGGQSVLEPAAQGRAIITGHHTANFKAAVDEFLDKEAIIQLPDLGEGALPTKLAEAFQELLSNNDERQKLADNAFEVMKQNRGATHKTMEYLRPYFETRDAVYRNKPLVSTVEAPQEN